jgi:hypothetical protein
MTAQCDKNFKLDVYQAETLGCPGVSFLYSSSHPLVRGQRYTGPYSSDD